MANEGTPLKELSVTLASPPKPAPPPESRLAGLRAEAKYIIPHFHMEWFAMVMGWGGVALVLNGFPPATGAGGDTAKGFNIAATVIWWWDLMYALIFTILLLARIILHPVGFWKMFRQSDLEPLFFGCVAMGIAVVGMGFIPFCPNIADAQACHTTGLVFFWIDVVLCAISMTVPCWMMMTCHSYTFEKMPAAWLLPLVSCVVCAAFAGVIGNSMQTNTQKLYVNVAGYILWGMGMLPAACVVGVFICRLFLFGRSPGSSAWVLLGPIGQGANAIMMLGRNTGALQCSGFLCQPAQELLGNTCLCKSNTLTNVSLAAWDASDVLAFDAPLADQLPLNPLASLGFIAPGVTSLIGMIMWGFGVWLYWLNASLTLTATHKFSVAMEWMGRKTCLPDADWAKDKHLPFAVPWWGVVFPMVTQTMSTYQLNTDTGFWFFYFMGAFFGAIVIVSGLYIHAKTLIAVATPAFWAHYHKD